MVASIICSVASATPLSASPSRITSQMPLSAHRRNCRKIEFQLPNSSGRSRHGAPVRINQNTASSTRRWLRGGRPPPRWIRNGSKYAHSSSVISPRIKAASQRAALNQFAILTSIGLSTRPSEASPSIESGLPSYKLDRSGTKVISLWGLALLWQIYSCRSSLQIHLRQCGHRCFGGSAISSRMA
jgi:hypothetical protein